MSIFKVYNSQETKTMAGIVIFIAKIYQFVDNILYKSNLFHSVNQHYKSMYIYI